MKNSGCESCRSRSLQAFPADPSGRRIKNKRILRYVSRGDQDIIISRVVWSDIIGPKPVFTAVRISTRPIYPRMRYECEFLTDRSARARSERSVARYSRELNRPVLRPVYCRHTITLYRRRGTRPLRKPAAWSYTRKSADSRFKTRGSRVHRKTCARKNPLKSALRLLVVAVSFGNSYRHIPSLFASLVYPKRRQRLNPQSVTKFHTNV